MAGLDPEPALHVPVTASEEDVFEMFDRYNLLCLPVVDEDRRILGVITADDVISLLRRKR
jgi:magnesium transporter